MTTKTSRRHFLEASALATGLSMFSRAGVGDLNASVNNQLSSRQKPLVAVDGKATQLLATMTLEEKIGQMTQAEQSGLEDAGDIEKYFLGSLLSGGSSDPKAGNSLAAWAPCNPKVVRFGGLK